MSSPSVLERQSTCGWASLRRRNRVEATRDEYRRKLNLLADDVRDAYVHEITLRDYERFLRSVA